MAIVAKNVKISRDSTEEEKDALYDSIPESIMDLDGVGTGVTNLIYYNDPTFFTKPYDAKNSKFVEVFADLSDIMSDGLEDTAAARHVVQFAVNYKRELDGYGWKLSEQIEKRFKSLVAMLNGMNAKLDRRRRRVPAIPNTVHANQEKMPTVPKPRRPSPNPGPDVETLYGDDRARYVVKCLDVRVYLARTLAVNNKSDHGVGRRLKLNFPGDDGAWLSDLYDYTCHVLHEDWLSDGDQAWLDRVDQAVRHTFLPPKF
jgi:hypothetical protein